MSIITHLRSDLTEHSFGFFKDGYTPSVYTQLCVQSRVCYIRDCSTFPSQVIHCRLAPCHWVDSNRPLGCRRKLYTNSIRQVIAIPRQAAVTTEVTHSAKGVLCRLFQLAKVTGAYVCIAVCLPIHSIFIVPLCSAHLVAHGYETPPCYRIWLRHAYLPTHRCHTSRLCANVLCGVSVKG